MIEGLLAKFGYFHKENVPLTEEDIYNLIVDHYEELFDSEYDKKEEKKLFDTLSKMEGFGAYLKATLGMDIKRYFKAVTEPERWQIRGAFSRTLYLRGLLFKKDKDGEKVELRGKRHA